MKFEKRFLEEDSKGTYETIEDIIIDHRRWSVIHKRIIKYENKFYIYRYSVGATEMQYEDYDPGEMIECPEVFPKKVEVIIYE